MTAEFLPAAAAAAEGTRAVHTPRATVSQRPVSPPVYRTAAWTFDSAGQFSDLLAGDEAGYSYSRVDNPTADTFAAAVAALEAPDGLPDGAPVAAQPFASGMAAISTTLLALCRADSEVILPRELYGGTYGLARSVLARYGVRTVFATTAEEVAAALRPGVTAAIYTETIANPTLTVADLPGLGELAAAAGVPLVVDSTFASPLVCRPLEHGADVVVHSATKYLGGHSDATGGVAVGRADLIARIRHDRIELGGCLAPDEAWVLHRGLATLPLRIERVCASALQLARALSDHPAVASVLYPGLPGHPDHGRARALFAPGRFGGCLTLTPVGGRAAGLAFCDALRLVTNTSSLGGTHSVVSHAASSTHRQFDDAALAAAGIGPATVRLSVGLEDPADLLADLQAALASLPGPGAGAH